MHHAFSNKRFKDHGLFSMETLVALNPPNRRGTDPYARWCGRGGIARCPPIPIDCRRIQRHPGSGWADKPEGTRSDEGHKPVANGVGLTPPWGVTRSEFDAAAHRLDIHRDFAPGSRFACPHCGAPGCPAHDTEPATWRHLNFFQHQTYLHARVPRIRCPRCGVKKIAVPWARKDSGFTLLFEALVMAMVTAMPVAAVDRLVGEYDTKLWRVIHHYVDQARERVDASEVTRVAIDETAATRVHNYITLFVDIDQARVLYATAGKDAATVRRSPRI
jgi:transposase